MKRALLLIAALVIGCNGDDSGKGTITLELSTPSTNDGAVVLLIAGGPVTAIHAAPGLDIATTVDAEGTHLVIAGDIAAGTIATLDIPELNSAARYVVVVQQVADRTSYALLDPSRYHVTTHVAND